MANLVGGLFIIFHNEKDLDNKMPLRPTPESGLCTFCVNGNSCRTVRSRTKLMNTVLERGRPEEAQLIFGLGSSADFENSKKLVSAGIGCWPNMILYDSVRFVILGKQHGYTAKN
ncbi:hypothetical protein K7X08_036441 [Anisodus acutangulus]|uniref:Uncharacterized protein n=1 Tax=Anisodus acutangulus TaxID=402998 RepID=A0A9Q1L6R4_9SOLA|nr:hypothetical protein K7X08_036441 [Anisodus acutangulus]